MVFSVAPALRAALRPYTTADAEAVLDLVNADRLPGQPTTTPEMLTEALAGRSPIDAGWWAELTPPTTHVALDPRGRVVGVISWAQRPKDDTGLILWLHCREDTATADALISHALTALGPRPVEAFHFATALTRGVEALPVDHRPVTHAALRRAGLAGEFLWRYFLIDLPAPNLPQADGTRMRPEPGDDRAMRLEVREQGRVVAESVVGLPVEGVGALWWIGVLPDVRGQGIGRKLLGSALEMLRAHQAASVFLYVEANATPGGEGDRTAATALYRSAGFREIDRLHSYSAPS
ncbi:GNAT family N-acetyltransferase [Streptomyces sp. NPDC054901]